MRYSSFLPASNNNGITTDNNCPSPFPNTSSNDCSISYMVSLSSFVIIDMGCCLCIRFIIRLTVCIRSFTSLRIILRSSFPSLHFLIPKVSNVLISFRPSENTKAEVLSLYFSIYCFALLIIVSSKRSNALLLMVRLTLLAPRLDIVSPPMELNIYALFKYRILYI